MHAEDVRLAHIYCTRPCQPSESSAREIQACTCTSTLYSALPKQGEEKGRDNDHEFPFRRVHTLKVDRHRQLVHVP
jgi:hypothetical protein